MLIYKMKRGIKLKEAEQNIFSYTKHAHKNTKKQKQKNTTENALCVYEKLTHKLYTVIFKETKSIPGNNTRGFSNCTV